MSESRSDDNRSDDTATSTLDNTLLESLFYHEMLMLNDGDGSNSFLSSLGGGLDPEDGHSLADHALLHDFLVPESPHPTNVGTVSDGKTALEPMPPLPGIPQVSEKPSSKLLPPAKTTESQKGAADEQTDEEKRTKLVSQFATLASRLGLNLTKEILQTLSKEGGPRDLTSVIAAANANKPQSKKDSASSTSSGEDSPSQTAQEAPVVQEMEKAAMDAIKTVQATRKRGIEESAAAAASVPKVQPKRRKKPQISECESTLARLKEENKMLKRHLGNVTSQAHKFNQERQEAEKDIRTMLEEGASGEKMNRAVHHYVEMYSDYGRHRQQELFFHLDQLQRLANPTNFTKMGLWTLGQHAKDPKKNPIGNLLTKELEVTSQQGRKIAEQRQKIQHVCSNLRECLGLLQKLKQLCEQKTQIFHDRLTKCRQILSPRQVIQLLVWIDENASVLGSVCPGWRSEQIQAPKSKR